jgi:hypothetical protein
LNLDCSAGGFANVELQTETGEPIRGYTLADSDRIYHNNLRKIATWKGQADLTSLAGRTVRLRLRWRNGKLYALQFARKVGSHAAESR